jgi:hypothetical protein
MPEVANPAENESFNPHTSSFLLWVYYERAALLLLPPATWLSMGAFYCGYFKPTHYPQSTPLGGLGFFRV